MTDGCFSLTDYEGADATSASASDAAMTAMIADMVANGRGGFIPQGRFKLENPASIVLPAGYDGPAFLRGAHRQLSQLCWPAPGGGLSITLNSKTMLQAVTIEDLALLTGVAGGGTALTIINNGVATGSLERSAVDRVSIKGADGGNATDYWSLGMSIQGLSYLDVDRLSIVGSLGWLGDGVRIIASEVVPSFISAFRSANFQGLQTCALLGSWVQGVTFTDNSNFGGAVGVDIPASESGQTQLFIGDSQSATSIALVRTASAYPDIIVHNNEILGGGLLLNQAQRGSILGNHLIEQRAVPGTAITIGVSAPLAIPGIIGPNIIEGYAVGIDQSGANPKWSVDPNVLFQWCTVNQK